MLNLTDISKKYGNHEVLNFREWKVPDGIHWLKGGNGTGKSTLFRIISGQMPFHGEVELDGVSLKKKPILFRSKISFAEAEPQYPSFVTGRELLEFYQEIRQAKSHEANYLADYFDLMPFLGQKTGGYSSGMLKKLSLICAFLGHQDLYILDEPFTTIDSGTSAKLYQLIKAKSLAGKSFLLSSHQQISRDQLQVDTIFQIIDKQPCPINA